LIQPEYLEKIQLAYLQYFKSITKQIVLIVNTSKLNFVESKDDYNKLVALINPEFMPGTHFINP